MFRRSRVLVLSIGCLVVLPFCHGSLLHAGSSRLSDTCAVHYPSDATVEWECRRVRKGESLATLFGERWRDVARFNRIDQRHARPGASIKVPKRLDAVIHFTPMPTEYFPAEGEAKFILIDLSEQFLGGYEYGALRFSLPVVTGEAEHPTPVGDFVITAAHRHHASCLYSVEGTETPYPMNFALRFYINKDGVSYWIHGRDMPGVPASHGCIGLYNESMQKAVYGVPQEPELENAQRLYDWVVGDLVDDGSMLPLKHGPRMRIIGTAPGGE